jgi:ADP-heptose:LPS heptosyltransferase
MSSKTRNIIFAAPTWLGDAVMSLPLLGFLGTAAGVRVTVLARSYAARVYWGLENVAELIVAPAGGRIRRILGLRGVLRRTGADGAVILAPSLPPAPPFVSGFDRRAADCFSLIRWRRAVCVTNICIRTT